MAFTTWTDSTIVQEPWLDHTPYKQQQHYPKTDAVANPQCAYYSPTGSPNCHSPVSPDLVDGEFVCVQIAVFPAL
jgi:hypothetical protein